ncbi:T9SS type A sorting domain-containing protein [Flavobacterium sp.]|uniref:T9SS type A sorting domain-containing protein n=1 Tax=Flavobacterium sp. TaxID=239 RepID=UPI0032640F64
MKKTLFCLLVFLPSLFYAQISSIIHCAGDTTFDLTSRYEEIKNQNSNVTITNIKYYAKDTYARNDEYAITDPKNFVFNESQLSIYYKIYISTGNSIMGSFLLILNSPLNIAYANLTYPSCANSKLTIGVTGGRSPYQYSLDGVNFQTNNFFENLDPGTYAIYIKDNYGCIVTSEKIVTPLPSLAVTYLKIDNTCFGTSNGKIEVKTTGGKSPYTYSMNGSSYKTSNIFTNLASGTYNITVKDALGCFVTYPVFITEPTILVATATVENQTITINATGGNANYSYGLDGVTYQPSNVFTNMAFGDHNIYVKDEYACAFEMTVTVNPPTPLINGKNTLAVEFTPGQTLGDIVVDGQNIKWYSSQNSLTGKTRKLAETTLPLTTVLIDGVTYYASQTINGIESKERLAVTAKSNGSLSTSDFVLPNLKYYPNPVHQNLWISNTEVIDEIEIFSIAGKSVLTKKINTTHSEIDLSGTSTGVYFIKVKSEGKIKTLKIVKE